MTELDFRAWIERESETFVSVLDTGELDRRVPGCPDWALRDLALHLARVQRFWKGVVLAGADIDPTRPEPFTGGDADLASWMRASTCELVGALHQTAPDTPAWTWWRDSRTAGAIARHQVQEAAVHRWDAQSALGNADPLQIAVADDGVDEFVGIARQLRDPAPISLVTTDSDRVIPVSDEPSVVSVTATASELVLLLYGRIPADALRVEGDRTVLDGWLMPIQ